VTPLLALLFEGVLVGVRAGAATSEWRQVFGFMTDIRFANLRV